MQGVSANPARFFATITQSSLAPFGSCGGPVFHKLSAMAAPVLVHLELGSPRLCPASPPMYNQKSLAGGNEKMTCISLYTVPKNKSTGCDFFC